MQATAARLEARETALAYREIDRAKWNAFGGVFLGWVLDAFDFNVLTFVLLDIQRAFTVDRALAGALGTVTLAMRLVGGVAAGASADKWGRKGPVVASVLWFSLFAFLSGFSVSYAMLFAFRALFGIGMGGAWAAGMPLVLEHWPRRFRGLVSGLLLGGWYWGYILAAAAFQILYPFFNRIPDVGWRMMFWCAVLPSAVLAWWIRQAVTESPVWLERQRLLNDPTTRQDAEKQAVSFARLFRRDLIGATIQTTLVMGAFMCSYQSIAFWYATFLREQGRAPLTYLLAFNVGAILGTAFWGRLSEGRLGRRGGITLSALLGVATLPLFLFVENDALRVLGAVLMGFFGTGAWGIVPAYLGERFPTSARGVGPGFSYHAGAALGAMTPIALGFMQDAGMALPYAMSLGIVVSFPLVATLVWFGPETRGRVFTSAD
jgi:SHS family lactate transporter-like MFS transporter